MPLKEGVHRAHHRRMPSEGADNVRHTRRLLRVSAGHVTLPTAQHADREAAAKGLAIHDHVRLDGVGLLRALGCNAEAGVYLGCEPRRNEGVIRV